MDAPRDDLVRMSPVIELRASENGDGNTLTGYAAVFNSDTVINSWEGNFTERIAPGAFCKTLRERRDQVKVLFNHGMDPSIGDKPLGKPSVMKEDERGLFVEVPLAPTSYNNDIRALLDSQALDGMSFRFSVVKETWEQPKRKGDLPVRTIDEAKLYEFGPVTFPAYEATTAGVRSRDGYRDWQSATDEQREAIRNILRTSATEAGSTTSDDEEPHTPPNEPVVSHSERTPKHARELRVKDIREVHLP